jgi:RimJ/RimL family protein N-acetyltransferase
MITGAWVALGPLHRALIPARARRHGDLRVRRTFGGVPRPTTIEQATARYARWATREDHYRFAIDERGSGRPIGHTDLFAIDRRARTGTFGIPRHEPRADLRAGPAAWLSANGQGLRPAPPARVPSSARHPSGARGHRGWPY